MVVRVSASGAIERDGQQIEIGGNERYVSLCRKHFSESQRNGVCSGWSSAGA
jgi:thymidine kinase